MSAEPERDPSIPKAFEVVGEHYQLLKKLGEGAFGVVYEARHDLLGQNFAVKILKPELCEDENLRERFLDEARALIRFSHENVVQLRHVGEHAGRLYLVMDLVEGLSLSDVIRRDGALGEQRAVSFILQVLHGLEAAHAAGIVHRDLKPGNLIVDVKPDGGERVRILDFGLSKLSSVDGMQSAHRSATGAIIGTLAYMSPEQLSGEKAIDARSDVFATGLILHEMLDGRHPFPGESGIVVAAKLLREAVPDLEPKKGSSLSDATRAALRTSLERDRDARFPSAFTFAQALEGKGPPSDTSRVTTIQEAKAALAVAETARAEKARTTAAGRKKNNVILVVVLAAIAAAVGIFFAMQDGEDAGTEAANQPGSEDPTLPTPADPGPGAGTPPTPPPVDPGPIVEPPVAPEPAPVDPGPAPVDPEPTVTPPVDPEPIVAPPVDPEPIVAPPIEPEPTDPGPAAVKTPPAETPTPPIEPADLSRDAQALQAKGKWVEAHLAWRQTLAADPMRVEALRGAAMTLLAKADAEARRGAVVQALGTLDGVIAFLTKQNVDVYRPAIQTNQEEAQRPMGFVHTHRGEAHAARARWMRVKGDAAAEKAALAEAEADLKLAWQYLERDGVHYWDFLLRRADFHRLNGEQRKAIEDLALTTQIASDLVPTRMWVAHFAGLRRAAEQMLRGRTGRAGAGRGPGRNKRRPGTRGNAAKLAEDARRLVRSGETWARTREEPFTRAEWLEAARVIVVSDIAAPATEDRNAFKGLLGWYLEQARQQPRPDWESAEQAEAQLRPLEAEFAVLEAKVAMKAKDMDRARQFSGEALAKAREGVRLAEKVAAAGGPLPGALPYAMLAYVLQAQGQEEPARKALERAREAGLRNPD